MTNLHAPVTIATEGEDLRVLYPNGQTLTLDNNDRGWEMLRKIVGNRERDSLPTIGKSSQPVQHMIDTRNLMDGLELAERNRVLEEARKELKELGL
jgi:hypothetical protein